MLSTIVDESHNSLQSLDAGLRLTAEQSRAIDRFAIDELGIHPLVLMENAARGVCDQLQKLCPSARLLVVCGKGNNGGDGLAIARHWVLRGGECQVLLAESHEKLSSDARANYEILVRGGDSPTMWDGSTDQFQDLLQQCDWIVDALLGTGVQGPPRAPYDQLIRFMNGCGKPIVAIDVPSGLDCDTGRANEPTINARTTATFVAEKCGFTTPDAKTHLGDVYVTDIGLPIGWLPNRLRGMD